MTHPIITTRVDFTVSGTAGRRSTCDRCGGRARYSGLGGDWCPGHWAARKKTQGNLIEQAAWNLAADYQVDVESMRRSLPDEGGFVATRQTSAPLSRLYYHPEPVELINRLLAEDAPKQRAQLQLARIAIAMWGLCLRWGSPLQGYPRDAQHHPADIPWGLVDWMESDARALQHLKITGMRLRKFAKKRNGKDCLAAIRLTWLLEHMEIGTLPVRQGPLQPPRWDVKLPDSMKRSA